MRFSSHNKFQSWISIIWSSLLMSIITYGVSSGNFDMFMIAMIVLLTGWCSAKILSDGFKGLINVIENNERTELNEDEDE